MTLKAARMPQFLPHEIELDALDAVRGTSV